MDYIVHGILQARILECVAFPSSRVSSQPGIEPRSPTSQVDSLPAEPQGKTKNTWMGSLSLLQRIFPTQELSWGLPHCRWILNQLSMREAKDCEDGLKYKAVASTSWIVWSLQTYFLSHPLYQQVKSKVVSKAQSCLTLCDPMDCSLPGSSVHGIFQAIVLEWIAISFSRGSSQPRNRTRVSRIVDKRFTVWATREVQQSPHIIAVPWYHRLFNLHSFAMCMMGEHRR